MGFKVHKNQWKSNEVIKHEEAELINAIMAKILNNAKTYIAECKLAGIEPDMNTINAKPSLKSFNNYLDTRASQYEAKDMRSAALT